jgi:gliding motility-associated-like protein
MDDSLNGGVQLVLSSIGNAGCPVVTDTLEIIIHPLAIVNALGNFSVCSGTDTIPVSGTFANAAGVVWSTNGTGSFYPFETDITTNYLPSAADLLMGHVTLTLSTTGATYCNNESDQVIITFTVPLAPDFAWTTPCVNGAVQFTDLTQIVAGTITGWRWLFDGANPDLNSSPQYVNPLPSAQFTSTIPCYYDAVNFSDISSVSAGNISNWNWDFGSGNTSSLQNPTFTFSADGIYPVTLNVVTDSICSASITTNVSVLPPPTASFASLFNCQTYQVSYTDQSQSNGNTLVAWNWVLGNGTTSTLQNPQAQYTDTGSYSVTLIVFASANCSDTIQQDIHLYNVFADFSFEDLCAYDSIPFTDVSVASNGTISGWQWTFGDETSSLVQNPNHLYSAGGNYDVTLVVNTTDGCSDTITKAVNPKPIPLAGFSATAADYNIGTTISFIDASSGGVQTWAWDFGDDFGTSTNASSSYTYTYPGNYLVSQTVTNTFGCIATATQAIVILDLETSFPPALPSAFTPNSDNNNDVLYVRGGPFTVLEFKVYNEWGILLFSSDDAALGWDGTYKSKDQPVGVYVYTVKATTVEGKEYSISGDVTLIR